MAKIEKIAIVNAGNCMLCGREIKIVTNRGKKEYPNIFFCSRCEHKVNKEKRKKGARNE